MSVPDKTYYQTDKTVNDSLRLARILRDHGNFDPGDDEHVPNAFIGTWRGGTYVACIVTGGMEGYGIRHHTYSIAGKSYTSDPKTGIGKQEKGVKLYNMEELAWYLKEHPYSTACVIDEVVDSGRTQHGIRHVLRNGLRKRDATHTDQRNGHSRCIFRMEANGHEYPLEVRMSNDEIPPLDSGVRVLMAAIHWKKSETITGEVPDFFVEEVSPAWKVYPWEAAADCREPGEFKDHYPEFHKILHE